MKKLMRAQKYMRAGDGKQCIYLERPNGQINFPMFSQCPFNEMRILMCRIASNKRPCAYCFLDQIYPEIFLEKTENYTLVGSNVSQRQYSYQSCQNHCNYTPIINKCVIIVAFQCHCYQRALF